MFSSRRLAKRSIIGTRVCCERQDGRYYPSVIQSTEPGFAGEELYTVYFADKTTATVVDKNIVGPGFQCVMSKHLKKDQKVFITHNGREVTGTVEDHDGVSDDVTILANLSNGQQMRVIRRLEEVRLMESRKSARLQDQDTDYSRLADLHTHSESKKRAVSHFIDVPLPVAKHSRRRKTSGTSSCTDQDEQMIMVSESDDSSDSMDTMDEHMAAMVLTALSCSPTSPSFPIGFTDKGSVSPNVASSFASSGIGLDKSEAGTPSPPRMLGSSSGNVVPLFGTPPIDETDEGIELDDTHAYFMESDYESTQSSAAKRRKESKTVFKCTWKGCGKLLNSQSGIEFHVRNEHLGPREHGDSDLSDHEEEFYFTEIEVSVDTVTKTFADMHTSSPPSIPYDTAQQSVTDHDYQKKPPSIIFHTDAQSSPQDIPNRRFSDVSVPHQGASFPMATSLHQYAGFSHSWNMQSTSPPYRKSSLPASRSFSNSPLHHKKSRSDVKKCRKVYGMENRDLWCTQCKWKKACSRFSE